MDAPTYTITVESDGGLQWCVRRGDIAVGWGTGATYEECSARAGVAIRADIQRNVPGVHPVKP